MSALDWGERAAAASPDRTAAVVAVASVIALFQLVFLYRQAKRENVQLLSDLGTEWRALRPSWDRAMLLARGPEDYYVNLSHHEVLEFARLREESEALADTRPDSDDIAARSFRFNENQRALRAYEVAALDVYRFLASVGLLVLDGTLSPRAAYAALGPELLRGSRPLRQLAGELLPFAWAGDDAPGTAADHSLAGWLDARPGFRTRTVVLIDILWSVAARLRDLPDDDLAVAAIVKRDKGTGKRNRRRVVRAALATSSPLSAARLWFLLRRSELRTFVNPLGVDHGARVRLPKLS